MTLERCPTCAAAVAAGATWCTLCYQDLRSAREPLPAVVAPRSPAASLSASTLSPLADSEPPPTATEPSGQQEERPASPLAVAVHQPSWPCAECGAQVPMTQDSCPGCSQPFLAPLAGDTGVPDVRRFGLPDPRQLSSAGRWGFGLALAAGLIVLLLVISYLVAAIG